MNKSKLKTLIENKMLFTHDLKAVKSIERGDVLTMTYTDGSHCLGDNNAINDFRLQVVDDLVKINFKPTTFKEAYDILEMHLKESQVLLQYTRLNEICYFNVEGVSYVISSLKSPYITIHSKGERVVDSIKSLDRLFNNLFTATVYPYVE